MSWLLKVLAWWWFSVIFFVGLEDEAIERGENRGFSISFYWFFAARKKNGVEEW